MKKLYVIIPLMLLYITASAQDVIFKKDGTQIQAKVSDITATSIKYKKVANPNGPNYELQKTEIIKIVYPDGSTDDFTKENESTADKSMDRISKLMKASTNAGNIKNGNTHISMNGKEYTTEFNKLTVMELARQESLVFKNRSAMLITLSATFVLEDKKIVMTLTMTKNDMKPATFKVAKGNMLEYVDGQFMISVNNINPNLNNGLGGGSNIPINNIKTGKLTISSIDKESRKIAGTIQVLGNYVDGGKIDLEGAFENIAY